MTLGSVSSSGRVAGRALWKTQGCYRHGASSGIGLEAVRRLVACGLPRGCQLTQHYIC